MTEIKWYRQDEMLAERVDWDNIKPMDRCAGGHDLQMKGLLKNSRVLAHWNEGDYQGSVATIVVLKDTGECVYYDDYYGSCSGCDAWEDADDKSALSMCKNIAANAYIFKDFQTLVEWLKHMIEDKPEEYKRIPYKELLEEVWKEVIE